MSPVRSVLIAGGGAFMMNVYSIDWWEESDNHIDTYLSTSGNAYESFDVEGSS